MGIMLAPMRTLCNLRTEIGESPTGSETQMPDFLRSYFGRRRRLSSFERDYPALLIVMSSMIKAGSDPFASLLECKVMFMDDSEMRSQLEKVCSAIHRGETESSAIDRFGDDIDFSEVALLREVLRLGRQEGASLGQALIRLARVTRQRQSFHRKARAALALQRLSSIGMFLCALCISVMQFLANPEAFWRALNHPVGSLFLGAGGLAVLLGLVWMLSLSRGRIGVC